MKYFKIIFCLSLMFICSGAYAEPNRVEWKDNAQSNFERGRAIIAVANPMIKRGQKFEVDIRFISEGGGGSFFNIFLLNPGAAMPASLAVFDDKKTYVGNLLEWVGGSRWRNTPNDWTYIPAGGYVGTTVTKWAGQLGFKTLPFGTYYLQMIYNKSFIAPRPDNIEQVLEFYKNFDRSELFRSNIVKFELVDKKPDK